MVFFLLDGLPTPLQPYRSTPLYYIYDKILHKIANKMTSLNKE